MPAAMVVLKARGVISRHAGVPKDGSSAVTRLPLTIRIFGERSAPDYSKAYPAHMRIASARGVRNVNGFVHGLGQNRTLVFSLPIEKGLSIDIGRFVRTKSRSFSGRVYSKAEGLAIHQAHEKGDVFARDDLLANTGHSATFNVAYATREMHLALGNDRRPKGTEQNAQPETGSMAAP